MNVLYLNNYHYVRGGAESVFLGEADLVARQGNKAYVFARQHPNNFPSPYDHYFPGEMVTDTLKSTVTGLQSLLQLFYSFDAKRCLTRMLQDIPIDIAHAHNIYGRLTTSVLDLLNKKDIPIVMTLHDYKLICPSYKLMSKGTVCETCKGNAYFHAVLNRCHKQSLIASSIYMLEAYFTHLFERYRKNIRFFVSPSAFLKSKLIEFGWSEEDLIHIPNFLSVSQFEPCYSPGRYFVYLGRLSPEKGLFTLVTAFMKVAFNQARLTIVGEGPIRTKLQSIAKNDPRIRFTGYLSGNSLKEIVRGALGVIIPSEWYENAPISVLEAFGFGKPVIASRIGGIPEMIDDGVNGYLFEPGNTIDLRNKLEELLDMPDGRIRDMGKAARRKVEKEYSAEMHYERLLTVYHRALSKS